MPEKPLPSIARTLTWTNVLVSTAALVLATMAFLLYDQYTFRESLVRTLTAQAQVVGLNSISALTFDDPKAAERTLSALESFPSIESAGIVAADGRLFAKFQRGTEEPLVNVPRLTAERTEAHLFAEGRVLVVRSIEFQGNLIGEVYVRASLQEQRIRLLRYGAIAALVLFLSVLFAYLVARMAAKRVAGPIVELAEKSRAISRDKNYGVRAQPSGTQQEVDALVTAFNEMLDEIEKGRKELEKRVADRTRDLVAANKELEAFSYSVSHDLRNPLDVVMSLAHVLQNTYGERLDAEGRESLRHLSAASRRMAELIDDLLNLSRVSTTGLHPESVNLTALVRKTFEEMRSREPERNVELVTEENVRVEGDSRFLKIVLDNLMRNAWKYTSKRERARIEFGRMRRQRRDVYYIRDNGAGFDPQYAERLFKPFQRLHSTTDFPGTGIGLATVQRIVERHGGQVWAEGELNHGATIYFTLGQEPAYREERQQTA